MLTKFKWFLTRRNLKFRGGGGGGGAQKKKGTHKSTAKEVSLKSPHLVFCTPKLVIAVDRLLLHFVMEIELEKGGSGFSL